MSAIVTHAALIVCFVAGKSGGHLLPCITQAEKILHEQSTSKVYLFSSGSQLDYKIMEKHQDIEHYVPTNLESIPYKKPWLFPYFFYTMGSYFVHAWYALWDLKPAKIISFGGLNSIPVCLAGMVLGIPFDLYELNVEPGLTTKFLSYFTNTIHICFAQTAQYFTHKHCVLAGYPVRFTQRDTMYDAATLLAKYSLSSDRKTILILGGSQGSVFINNVFKDVLNQDSQLCKKIQVIHQIGIYDQDDYKKLYEQHAIPAVVFTYNEQLQNFYNLADLIICRAGAGTLFEVEFFKKPCIVIPLETELNNHQVQNARAISAMFPQQFMTIGQKECPDSLLPSIHQKLFL